MSNKTTGKKKNKRRSIVRKMWTWFAIFVGLLVLLFVLIYNGVIGYMPPIDQLKTRQTSSLRLSTAPMVWRWDAITAAAVTASMWTLTRCRPT